LKVLDVPLERDVFLRSLVRHLSGALQDVVGLNEASGFVTIVGQRMGDDINEAYRSALGVDANLSRAQVAAVLVDLKRRIQGDFYVIDETEKRIVLGNRACPFGDRVHDRPALCMMTSNVFGRIASENLGYAKVVIEKSIANHDPECRVVVHLEPTEDAKAADGREYIKG
jgi:predicted ArsR family transcriptional regulator